MQKCMYCCKYNDRQQLKQNGSELVARSLWKVDVLLTDLFATMEWNGGNLIQCKIQRKLNMYCLTGDWRSTLYAWLLCCRTGRTTVLQLLFFMFVKQIEYECVLLMREQFCKMQCYLSFSCDKSTVSLLSRKDVIVLLFSLRYDSFVYPVLSSSWEEHDILILRLQVKSTF